jgi:hypothetical protein
MLHLLYDAVIVLFSLLCHLKKKEKGQYKGIIFFVLLFLHLIYKRLYFIKYQGFIIFIIVVLKARTIKSIKKFVLGIPASALKSINTTERKFSKSSSGSSIAVTPVHRNP